MSGAVMKQQFCVLTDEQHGFTAEVQMALDARLFAADQVRSSAGIHFNQKTLFWPLGSAGNGRPIIKHVFVQMSQLLGASKEPFLRGQ